MSPVNATIHRLWMNLHLQRDLDIAPLPRLHNGLLLIIHLIGLVAIIRLSHEWVWVLLPLGWFMLPVVKMVRTRRRDFMIDTLVPMLLVYCVLGTRIGLAVLSWLQDDTVTGLVVPQTPGRVLNIAVFALLSLAWIWAVQARPLAQAFGFQISWQRSLMWMSAGLLVATLGWAIWTYFDVRTRGVTASDPYAYVQMGHDFAHGLTLEHKFELTSVVADAELPTYPVVPVGYRVPDIHSETAATVWPPGFAVMEAIAYILVGEVGFYLVAPICGLLTLGALALLSHEILRDWGWEYGYQWLATAIGVSVLATSALQLHWLGVPMADVPAQFFSTLTVVLALIAIRQPTVSRTSAYAFVGGIALGFAFATRYTQVLMGLSVIAVYTFAYLIEQRNIRAWLQVNISAGIGAWLAALPVLWYHQTAFGSPLTVGSEELNLFASQWVDDTLSRMVQDALAYNEFFWLLPFLLWGTAYITWRDRRMAAILGLWFVAIVGFHLPYAALRLRDLLTIFPLLALCIGIGVADLLRQVRMRWTGMARLRITVLVLALFAAAFWLRIYITVQITGDSFRNFGHLTAAQRDVFDDIADITPENAVIAVSDNSGPIILYSERDIVRPKDWSASEWLRFIDIMQQAGRPLYMLVDGEAMRQPFEIAETAYPLEAVASFKLPYYYPGGGSEVQPVALYSFLEQDTQ